MLKRVPTPRNLELRIVPDIEDQRWHTVALVAPRISDLAFVLQNDGGVTFMKVEIG
jgi:hypothetical protein